MFSTHAHMGKERWEVYSWAMRDIMSWQGNLKKCDLPNGLKNKYYKFMMDKKFAQVHPDVLNHLSVTDS